MLGFAAAMLLAVKRAKAKNIKTEDMLDLTLFLLISGVIGCRLSYVATNWDYYAKRLAEIPNLTTGGLSWHGGLILAIITAIIFTRVKKINMGDLFDCIAPAFPLGQAIGRIGCFLNGCCGGKAFGAAANALMGKIKPFNTCHPTQLYEVFLDILLLAFLLAFERRAKFKGELFLIYLCGYSVIRFFLEFLRDHLEKPLPYANGALFLGQYVSLAMFLISLICIITLRVNKRSG